MVGMVRGTQKNEDVTSPAQGRGQHEEALATQDVKLGDKNARLGDRKHGLEEE
jgi:hypothetical protein